MWTSSVLRLVVNYTDWNSALRAGRDGERTDFYRSWTIYITEPDMSIAFPGAHNLFLMPKFFVGDLPGLQMWTSLEMIPPLRRHLVVIPEMSDQPG